MGAHDRQRWADVLVTYVEDVHPYILTLEAIQALHAEDKRPPTYRDVARVRGLTIGGVQHHFRLLRRAGLLPVNNGGTTRCLRLGPLKSSADDWVQVANVQFSRKETRKMNREEIVQSICGRLDVQLEDVDLTGTDIEVKVIYRP